MAAPVSTGNPLPADLQSLFDAVVNTVGDAQAADATKAQTAATLSTASTADQAAAADQIAKHQAATAASAAFVAKFQTDFPPQS